jgi:hypothetical protein
VDFLIHIEGVWFLSGFPPFSFTETACERLLEFEEIEISRKSCGSDCE